TAVPQPCGTKRAVNLVGPDGRRLSLYDATRWAGTDRLPEETVRRLAGVSRHAHVGLTRPRAGALPPPRAADRTITPDRHDWDSADPYLESFALAADLVSPSAAALPEPEATTRRSAERGRARVVVATAGAEGALLLAPGGTARIPAAAPPAPVVDSNGA